MRHCRGQKIQMEDFLLKEYAKAFAKDLGIEFSARKVDTDITVWEIPSEAEIKALYHNSTKNDDDESEELNPITLTKARESLNKIAKTGSNIPRRIGMKNVLSIGTWNIRTPYKGLALQNLIDVCVDYHIDVLSLQEIRWLDPKDCTLYYSCQEKAHPFGVGFIVNKRLRNTVVDFQAISMRLCKIRLRGRQYNTTLICAHTPTDDKDETEKDLFYDLLMKSYKSCPAQDMKLVIGDFNAKIGRELFISYNPGFHSLHKETNENGQILWDFAASENLFIISTAFPYK
ncbi:craniofacial development protein 2 [Trichonephila clavipes]|uniref:Craniofacial development protein 2 n=1 Tax=Trichonephila clavipes TaxID=2585209 RepID=A0A8X6RRY6_TRICX|nr:craniofacial development protein 2 [Trichonephila clavipes]